MAQRIVHREFRTVQEAGDGLQDEVDKTGERIEQLTMTHDPDSSSIYVIAVMSGGS